MTTKHVADSPSPGLFRRPRNFTDARLGFSWFRRRAPHPSAVLPTETSLGKLVLKLGECSERVDDASVAVLRTKAKVSEVVEGAAQIGVKRAMEQAAELQRRTEELAGTLEQIKVDLPTMLTQAMSLRDSLETREPRNPALP